MNPFYILGIIHRDEAGDKLLEDWLEKIRPQVITLELSNYGLNFREKNSCYYRQRLDSIMKQITEQGRTYNTKIVAGIYRYLEVPYEFKKASQYIRINGGSLYLVDMDIFSMYKLNEIDNFINIDNIAVLVNDEGDRDEASSEYVFARLYFEKGIKSKPYTEEMRIRDMFMSERIALLMRCYPEQKFLHICGWQHLQDPYNLYSSMEPIKAFIYDKTFCI